MSIVVLDTKPLLFSIPLGGMLAKVYILWFLAPCTTPWTGLTTGFCSAIISTMLSICGGVGKGRVCARPAPKGTEEAEAALLPSRLGPFRLLNQESRPGVSFLLTNPPI